MIAAKDPSAKQDAAQMSPAHDARDLTQGGASATITLDGQTYTLRITRTGKLILTK
jgi:hemin uptake protein HemP